MRNLRFFLHILLRYNYRFSATLKSFVIYVEIFWSLFKSNLILQWTLLSSLNKLWRRFNEICDLIIIRHFVAQLLWYLMFVCWINFEDVLKCTLGSYFVRRGKLLSFNLKFHHEYCLPRANWYALLCKHITFVYNKINERGKIIKWFYIDSKASCHDSKWIRKNLNITNPFASSVKNT